MIRSVSTRLLGAGMMLACCCGFQIGCSPKEEAAAPKFQVADSTDAKPGESDAGTSTNIKPAPPSIPDLPPSGTNPNDNPAPNPAEGTPPLPEIPVDSPAKIGVDGELNAGEVEQLIQVLTELENERPPSNNPQERQEWIMDVTAKKIAIAAQIVQSSSNTRQRLLAMNIAFENAAMLRQFGHPAGQELLTQLSRRWATDKSPEVAKAAQLVMFQLATADLVQESGKGSERYFAFVDKYLPANKNDETFESAQQACLVLAQSNLPEEAKKLKERLDKVFADSKNPLIPQALKALDEVLWLTDVKFMDTFEALLSEKEGSQAAYREFLAKVASHKGLGLNTVANLTSALFALERKYPELAEETAKTMEQAFGDSEDPRVKEGATEAIEGSRKRLALIGQPFEVDGITWNGKLFDWSAYQGKVVLIDFWATWCVPCLEEIPNIEQNYEDFHEKGFDVVGINLDKDAEVLNEWLQAQPLMWTTLVSSDKEKSGFENPLALKCGVEAIPFVMLVGKDGKVDSIHVRGPALRERLIELLGPPQGSPDKSSTPPSSLDAPANSLRPANPAQPPAEEAPAEAAPAEEKPAVEPEEKPAAPAAEKPAEPAPESASVTTAIEEVPTSSNEGAGEDKEEAAPTNPYLAKPNLSADQLIEFLQKMEEKPKSIRRRDGFAAAVVEACDRVLAAEATASQNQYAAETKGLTLHERAAEGDAQAQKQLDQFTAAMQNDTRPRIARLVDLFAREQKSLTALDGTPAEIEDALRSLREYFATEKLEQRHLRLASNTVALVNKLEDDELREKYYQDLGNLYAKSRDRMLAKYGKKLAKSSASGGSDLIGKSFEYTGTLVDGGQFDMEALRGKVVIVDFWATWCGPCLRELPRVREAYDKYNEAGLEVVGINLDEEREALTTFLDENPLPWRTMFGEGNQAAAEKYGVRGIPTLILIDREGKILDVAHSIEQFHKKLESLLVKN